MQREFKRLEKKTSAMGMGCWAIGGQWDAGGTQSGWIGVDDKESINAIHAAIDAGIDLFDTAAVYGYGHSESILGQALKGKRQDVFIATKFSNTFDEEKKIGTGVNMTPESIRKECDDSLRRLQTDYIDLYQLHHQGASKTEVEIILEELEKLVATGKIRSYGWSTDSVTEAKMFVKMENCSAIQYELNIVKPSAQARQALIDLCENENLIGLNRGPLAMGLLSGKYPKGSKIEGNDIRSSGIHWLTYFDKGVPNQQYLNMLDAIKEIITSEGRSLVQGALAWIWAASETTVPIPGIKTVKQAKENAAAMQFGPLSQTQFKEVNSIVSKL